MRQRASTLGLILGLLGAACVFTSRPMIPGATAESDAGADNTRNHDAGASANADAAPPITGVFDSCDHADGGADGGDAARDASRDGSACDPDAGPRDAAPDGRADDGAPTARGPR